MSSAVVKADSHGLPAGPDPRNSNPPKADAGKALALAPAEPFLPDDIIERALATLEADCEAPGPALTSPTVARDYLRLRLAGLEHEVRVVLFLDSQHRLIAAQEMFRGTLTQTSVFSREVARAALRHNAASVVFAHNHPSGLAEPSRADEC